METLFLALVFTTQVCIMWKCTGL